MCMQVFFAPPNLDCLDYLVDLYNKRVKLVSRVLQRKVSALPTAVDKC